MSRNDYYLLSMFSAGCVVFILPTLVALIRRTEQTGMIVFLNALTLVTGVTWFAAMLMACMMPKRLPRQLYFNPHDVVAAPSAEQPDDVTYFVWWTDQR